MSPKRPTTKTVVCHFCNRRRPASHIVWDTALKGWLCKEDCYLHVLAKIQRESVAANPPPMDLIPMDVVQDLLDALQFYADPMTYFAIGFFPDKPCGDFIDDFEDDCVNEDGIDLGCKPGTRARNALKMFAQAMDKRP